MKKGLFQTKKKMTDDEEEESLSIYMGWAVAPEPERNDTFSFSSHEFVLP